MPKLCVGLNFLDTAAAGQTQENSISRKYKTPPYSFTDESLRNYIFAFLQHKPQVLNVFTPS